MTASAQRLTRLLTNLTGRANAVLVGTSRSDQRGHTSPSSGDESIHGIGGQECLENVRRERRDRFVKTPESMEIKAASTRELGDGKAQLTDRSGQDSPASEGDDGGVEFLAVQMLEEQA